MRPDPRFQSLPKDFWAAVRSVSECLGYTTRQKGTLKTPSIQEIATAFEKLRLDPSHILNDAMPTALGRNLVDYFHYRADRLENYVEPRLMNVDQARELFEETRANVGPKTPIPMNKQKGERKHMPI